jgi:glycosyltransferase involved in cell wall biosynthesis
MEYRKGEVAGAVSKAKLVYVLPTYDADSQEHMFHIYGFLEALAEHLEVLLIIERARGQPNLHNLSVYQRHLQIPIIRALEVLVVMLWARLRGYKRFYSHYSISAAILSALVARVLGGVSYHWSCVHTLDFVPRHIRTRADLKLKLRNQYLLGLALHLVHHLVTGTPTMARYYSDGYGLPLSSVRVMPNWVDLERFESLPDKTTLRAQLGWPGDRKVVLFLHRVVERKGAHLIVPIVREVIARYPENARDLLFVVAGSGPYETRLKTEVETEGLVESVRLVGGVPNREAIRYFAAADVYMVPSLEEGFPRTLLEAMAAGCPFTTTDVGGVRDILTPEQAQFMAAVGDVQGMAALISRLLTDQVLRASLIRAGYQNVLNYAQDRVVQVLVAMVSE